MLTKLRRLLQPPNFPDAEKNLVSVMLHRLLLTVIGVIIFYLVIALVINPLSQYLGLGFLLLFVQIILFALLHSGRTSLVEYGFIISALAGLFYSTYQFGGVNSASYSALVIVVIISAIISRKRTPFIVAGLGILFGGLLIISDFLGIYQHNMGLSDIFNYWVGSSLIFILSALLVVQAVKISRTSIDKAILEIEQRRDMEETLREQKHYLEALNDITLSVVNRLEVKPLLESILTHAEELAELSTASLM